MALKDTFFGTPTRTALTIGGAVALVALVMKRKQVTEVVMTTAVKAELAAVRLLMPKGTEYLADLAFELAPQYGVSPLTILGITYAESNFGRALKPAGPEGTGDFIPRSPKRCVARNAKGACTKTLGNLVQELGFPVTVQADGSLKPTVRGWGHGLYQIDLMSHYPFIATGKWADPREAMIYALKLYAESRDRIKKAFPNIGPVDLLKATIASYNAGYPNVIAALKAGVPANMLDKGANKVTYSEGYVEKILDKARGFEPAS